MLQSRRRTCPQRRGPAGPGLDPVLRARRLGARQRGDPDRRASDARRDDRADRGDRGGTGSQRSASGPLLRLAERRRQGDFGISYKTGEDVGEAIASRLSDHRHPDRRSRRLRPALQLRRSAFSARRGPTASSTRRPARVALLGASTPQFFLGAMLIYAFAVSLGWFPTFGFRRGPAQLGAAVDFARHAAGLRSEPRRARRS